MQFFHPLPLQLLVVALVWVMVFSPGGGSPAIHRPLDLPPGVIPGTGNSKIYGKVCVQVCLEADLIKQHFTKDE